MKLLKYILLFLFSLLLNWNVSANEIVIVKNIDNFSTSNKGYLLNKLQGNKNLLDWSNIDDQLKLEKYKNATKDLTPSQLTNLNTAYNPSLGELLTKLSIDGNTTLLNKITGTNWSCFKSAIDIVGVTGAGYQIIKSLNMIIKNRKAIVMSCMLNYNIRKAPNIFKNIPSTSNRKFFYYLESLRVGKKLSDVWLANGVDDLLDAVYNTQKGIISKYKGSISNASRNAKGVFGEVATDVKFAENGFEALHVRKGQNGDLLDGWGETGLDHVFKKDGTYYIVDLKYGTAKLNKNTIDGPQMSDPWIGGSNRLSNAVGIDLAEDILDSDYIRIVSNISDDGSVILKELDEFGEIIGDFSF